MSPSAQKIKELEDRLERLVRTQIGFQKEISAIRDELSRARNLDVAHASSPLPDPPFRPIEQPKPGTRESVNVPETSTFNPVPRTVRLDHGATRPPSFGKNYESTSQTDRSGSESQRSNYVEDYISNAQSNVEKFIGENLISKIGIVILILGFAIGAKYAIDNELVSPTARIIMGYVGGFTLLFGAVRFRDKYKDFSAVLLSGGLAILYFITYFAHAVYGLIPQPAAFVVMVMLTGFSVASAIFYQRQIIAHIGLVGAYAVPFLLSSNSGNYAFLFAYMAIINIGILLISVKEAWSGVFYTSSIFTWLIFAAWMVDKFESENHLILAFGTLGIFYLIFYATTIVRRQNDLEDENYENLISATVTTFIFFLFVLFISSLSTDLNHRVVIFSFIGVSALTILFTSFKYFGNWLAGVTYCFTWLIFLLWFGENHSTNQNLVMAAIVASSYFLIFYLTTLWRRLYSDDFSPDESIGALLTNSFIFFGVGYAILDLRTETAPLLGLYTAGHGLMHSVTSQIVSRLRLDAIDVVQTLAVLIITFATIAVPIQIDGHYITLIWSIEAAVLFYFGRVRAVRLFEYLSYPLMALATLSLVSQWLPLFDFSRASEPISRTLLFNGDVVTGLVFVAAFTFIYQIHRRHDDETVLTSDLLRPFGVAISALAVLVLYNVFRLELSFYFELMKPGPTASPYEIDLFAGIAQFIYTLVFLLIIAIVNLTRVRSELTAAVNVGFILLTLIAVCTDGLYSVYRLRQIYLAGNAQGIWGSQSANVVIRYVVYGFIALALVALYRHVRDSIFDDHVSPEHRVVAFDSILYPTVLLVLSCELMHLAAHLSVVDADKFGLSILWGLFSLIVIVIGIKYKKKYLRIGAFVLLAATLIKLFFYDATDLPTIPKTILFVALGLLMLGISFLYNKFRSSIFANADSGE